MIYLHLLVLLRKLKNISIDVWNDGAGGFVFTSPLLSISKSPKLLYLENIVVWLSLPIFYEQITGRWRRGLVNLRCKGKIKCRGSVPWDILLWPQHCGMFIKQSTVRPVSNVCVVVLVNIFFCINSLGLFRWPRHLRRGSAASRLLELRVRILPRAWVSFSCECCVLSARDICVGLITRPEEFYRVLCVCVCDDEASIIRRPCPSRGSRAMKKVDNRGLFSHFYSSTNRKFGAHIFFILLYNIPHFNSHLTVCLPLFISLVVNKNVMLVYCYNCVCKIITSLCTLMSDNMPPVSLTL